MSTHADVSSLFKRGGTRVATGHWMKYNGAKITPKVEKGYAVITRTWKKGDKIDLELPMKVQRIKASDKIAATRGQVALRYGPLMYTAENVDQDITGKLAADSTLTPEWRADLLG